MKDGRIVETGPHDALIARQGLYANLYALNYASFDDMPQAAADNAADRPTST